MQVNFLYLINHIQDPAGRRFSTSQYSTSIALGLAVGPKDILLLNQELGQGSNADTQAPGFQISSIQ